MTKIKIKHVIFDWSGTLYDDHKVSFLSTRDTIKHFSQKNISFQDYKDHFTLPAHKFYRRYDKKTSFQKIDAYYFKDFAKYYNKGQLFAGVLETLKLLKKHKISVSIFSTVKQDLLDEICKALQIKKYFVKIQGSVINKTREFKQHLQDIGRARHALPLREHMLFIGDTDHDVEAAKKNHLISGCVLNGYHSTQKLLKGKPRFVWQSQHDWIPFFKRLQKPLPQKQPPERPLATVGALVFNTKGQVFITLTHKWGYTYGIPGGKIDKGEQAQHAVIRELFEETQLKIKPGKIFMIQDCINSKEFYIKKSHQILINYLAKTNQTKFVLNDEAVSALWIDPKLALNLHLNQPTRLLIKKYLKSK